MKFIARLGVLSVAALAVLGAAAAQASAGEPIPPLPVAAAGLPTWDAIKSLTVEEAVKHLPHELQQKTTSDPLYSLLKSTKLEQLPPALREPLMAALAQSVAS